MKKITLHFLKMKLKIISKGTYIKDLQKNNITKKPTHMKQ